MDALESLRRNSSIVSKPPLLVEKSNHGFEMESPIFSLPTEITLLIFQQFKSCIRHLLTPTHTCQRWRRIGVNDPSLWTHLNIGNRFSKETACLDNFLAILEMQMDRTANLLLDVEWHAQVDDEFFVPTLQLVRAKAPFSRWRTLEVQISRGSLDWSIADRFTNLESLIIRNGSDNTIFGVINRTVTSRLKVLEVKWLSASPAKIVTAFAKSLTHISSLRLKSLPGTRHAPFFPANVVSLQLNSGWKHPFPHIQTYKLRECTFTGMDSIDLQRMTILIVSRALAISFNCHIILPALRELKVATLKLTIGAKIEAPSLDTLHFMRSDGIFSQEFSPDTNRSLLERGYLLSPSTSLIADSHLSSTTLINLLAKSPNVTHVTLRLDHWARAQVVLNRLLGLNLQFDSPSAENEILCPRMSELRLDFGWELTEPSVSKEWLLHALKSREEASIMPPLSIYAGWKGEGTYMHLKSR